MRSSYDCQHEKVQAVVRRSDREKMLQALHQLGVLHIVPIDAAQAVADAEVSAALDQVRRSEQILAQIAPAGTVPILSGEQVAAEVASVSRSQAEHDSRLASLHRQLEQQAIWGDVTLEDIETLRSAGINPMFYAVPKSEAGAVEAEFSVVLSEVDSGRVVVAIVDQTSSVQLPPGAELLPLPSRDNASIRAEAAEVDARIKQNGVRLAELAHLLPSIRALQQELEVRAQFSIAANGGLNAEDLFAIEGWAPADESQSLALRLADAGVSAGIRMMEPAEEETPPTLIKYPKWVSPIKGLFDILGTFPGYHEIDLAAFFMIAMPVFAAILIGDGGYGLLFLGLGVFLSLKMSDKIGAEAIRLIMIVGVATLIWGILTANFFGVSPETMAHAAGGDLIDACDEVVWDKFYDADGVWASVGNAMIDVAPLWREDGADSRELLIQISFILGALHLISAHIRRMIGLLPSQQALAEVGWSAVLAAMLGVIWSMFFVEDGESGPVPGMVIVGGLLGGLLLVVLFGAPDKNPLKRVLVGFASALLPMISTFGDTMSYIRLMAVGLASYYIAFAFNDLGATIAESGTWGAAVPILIIGHGLNIVLCIIAIFAHGVRLNMLEFSNNAGVQWAGYAYAPFSKTKT